MTCETCGEASKFQGYRPKTVTAIVGDVRLSRDYYYCSHCKHGQFPRDRKLGLSPRHLSRGAAQLVTLSGTLTCFREAALEVLPKLSGLRVCESTVERTTESAGEQIGQHLADGKTFGDSEPWKWTKDAEGQTCAYVAADLTGVAMQGPDGAEAEGRMVAVGMVWNAGREGESRYVANMTGGQAELAIPLRRQAGQVGMDAAERHIALSDGGAGLEELLKTNFPRVEVVILDFYHAAEHLCDWAKVLNSQGEEADRVSQEWCHRLKHEGGEVVLAALRALEVTGRSEAVQKAHRGLLVYMENQLHRMDYPSYRAKGWMIGSGSVEAACKQVVGQRMKGSGMRWSEPGADAVSHARALFRSEKGQWDAAWTTLVA